MASFAACQRCGQLVTYLVVDHCDQCLNIKMEAERASSQQSLQSLQSGTTSPSVFSPKPNVNGATPLLAKLAIHFKAHQRKGFLSILKNCFADWYSGDWDYSKVSGVIVAHYMGSGE